MGSKTGSGARAVAIGGRSESWHRALLAHRTTLALRASRVKDLLRCHSVPAQVLSQSAQENEALGCIPPARGAEASALCALARRRPNLSICGLCRRAPRPSPMAPLLSEATINSTRRPWRCARVCRHALGTGQWAMDAMAWIARLSCTAVGSSRSLQCDSAGLRRGFRNSANDCHFAAWLASVSPQLVAGRDARGARRAAGQPTLQ